MIVVEDLKSFDKKQFPSLVLALGNFDGVHRGHVEIFSMLEEQARKLNGKNAVLTFKEHPQRVLHARENPKILTSLPHKLDLMEKAGVDLCFLLDFTVEFAEKAPETFVREVLVAQLGVREICLGFNARFGHNRSGDSRLMAQLAQKYGFIFLESKPYLVDGEVVSSTRIRSLIEAGDLKQASKLLGRPYSFFADVVAGEGKGKTIGFPTLNLDSQSEVMPKEGVYACCVKSRKVQKHQAKAGVYEISVQTGPDRQGVMNYGRKPTVQAKGEPIAEIHVLQWDQSLSKSLVEVTVGAWIRSEKKFSNLEALKHQIEKDVQAAQKWFYKEKE